MSGNSTYSSIFSANESRPNAGLTPNDKRNIKEDDSNKENDFPQNDRRSPLINQPKGKRKKWPIVALYDEDDEPPESPKFGNLEIENNLEFNQIPNITEPVGLSEKHSFNKPKIASSEKFSDINPVGQPQITLKESLAKPKSFAEKPAIKRFYRDLSSNNGKFLGSLLLKEKFEGLSAQKFNELSINVEIGMAYGEPKGDFVPQGASKSKAKNGYKLTQGFVNFPIFANEILNTSFEHRYNEIWTVLGYFNYITLKGKITSNDHLKFYHNYSNPSFNFIKFQFDIYLNRIFFQNSLSSLFTEIPNEYDEKLPEKTVSMIKTRELGLFCKEALLILFELLKLKITQECLIPFAKTFPIFESLRNLKNCPSTTKTEQHFEPITKRWGKFKEYYEEEEKNRVFPALTPRDIVSKNSEEGIIETQDCEFKPHGQPATMRISLYDYQLQGLSWLLFREGVLEKEDLLTQKCELYRDLHYLFEEYTLPDKTRLYFSPFTGFASLALPQENRNGGLLADEKGLGKTLMMIALIHVNPPSKAVPLNKLASAHNWLRRAGTLIFCPRSNINLWVEEIERSSQSGFISTFVFGSKNIENIDLSAYDVVIAPFQQTWTGTILLDYYWHRIILDDFQNASGSKWMYDVMKIESLNRWCVSATPIMKGLEEIIPVLGFLRTDFLGESFWWKNFVNKIDRKERSQFVGKFLRFIMLRRSRQTLKLENPEILQETIQYETVIVDQRPFEREVYVRMVSSLKGLNSKNSSKNVTMCFTSSLVKLRKLCDAVSLVFRPEDLNNMSSIESVIEKFLKEPDIPSFDSLQNNNFLEKAKEEVLSSVDSNCQICFEDIETAGISRCGHVLCFKCFEAIIKKSASCPLCRVALSLGDVMKVERHFRRLPNDGKNEGSSKLDKVREIVRGIKEKGEKCLICSQFSEILDMIEDMLNSDGITSRKIQGKSNKQNFLKKIADDNNISALLIIVRKGSCNLKIPGFSNVIFVEPSMNPLYESQIVGCLERKGKEITVKNLACRNTIEELMLKAQKEQKKFFEDLLILDELKRKEIIANMQAMLS